MSRKSQNKTVDSERKKKAVKYSLAVCGLIAVFFISFFVSSGMFAKKGSNEQDIMQESSEVKNYKKMSKKELIAEIELLNEKLKNYESDDSGYVAPEVKEEYIPEEPNDVKYEVTSPVEDEKPGDEKPSEKPVQPETEKPDETETAEPDNESEVNQPDNSVVTEPDVEVSIPEKGVSDQPVNQSSENQPASENQSVVELE